MSNAFGIEAHTEVAKAFTKKGKAAKEERKRLHGTLTRKEMAGVALGGPAYTALKAPKGKKKAAAKTMARHTYKRGQDAYSGHAKAKEEHFGKSAGTASAFGIEHG